MSANRFARFLHRHRVELILFFTFWLSFSYFYHFRNGWNSNSRYDLTCAIVERGTLSIDAYHEAVILNTGDKAQFNGHFYSDKAPALSFLAVPAYAIIRPLVHNSDTNKKTVYTYWLTIIFTVSLLAAAAAVLFYKMLRIFGATNGEAILLTFLLMYGTNVGGYTSLFFPYLPAIASLLGAYVLLLRARQSEQEIGVWRALAIGFLISMAGFLEFTFGLAGAVLMLLAWTTMRPRMKFLFTILGAVPPVVALMAYNWTLFHALTLPYQYEFDPLFRQQMQRGFMGIAQFQPAVLWFITLHPFKGLFFYSPFLLAFVAGSYWVRRLGPWGADLLAAWAIVTGYLLFNSSYYMWWGGWSMGSRHLVAMIPFMFLPIVALMHRYWALAALVVVLGIIAVLLNFPAIAIDPQIPARYSNEALFHPQVTDQLQSVWLRDILPAFYKHGQVAINPLFNFERMEKFMQGELSPWIGRLSLVPLYMIWIVGLASAWRIKD